MSLTQAQIQRLGKLTALEPDKDLTISTVLDSFDSLAKTDTSSVEQVSRSGATVMTLRTDQVRASSLPDALLDCSHQRKAAHQIVL